MDIIFCVLFFLFPLSHAFVLFRFLHNKMVQPAISVRKVVAADIQYADEAAKVINGAYRSGGKINK